MVSRCQNQRNRPIFFKSAQKSDFLEPCPVWAHLPGNVNFLTRSTRYKSGLVMVKCLRWNFFWVISNCKSNEICETTRMKLWSTWEHKTMVRTTFLTLIFRESTFFWKKKWPKKIIVELTKYTRPSSYQEVAGSNPPGYFSWLSGSCFRSHWLFHQEKLCCMIALRCDN